MTWLHVANAEEAGHSKTNKHLHFIAKKIYLNHLLWEGTCACQGIAQAMSLGFSKINWEFNDI